MANMPLMWVFAMRNNLLLWLTGWSFTTFNQFHRWIARIATIEAVIHSIGYTVEAFLGLWHSSISLKAKRNTDGGKTEYVEEWNEQYWYMGVIVQILLHPYTTKLMCQRLLLSCV